MLCICVLIAVACIVYLILSARRAAAPAFAARGVLTGEKLGYMLSALAYGAKRTYKGNGIGMREIKRKLYAARRAVGKRLASGKTLEACERTFFDSFYKIDEATASAAAARRAFRRLPHAHGRPRLYGLCELLVKSNGGVLHADAVRHAVHGYCAETPLSYAEICALGNMLRLCLCEYIAMYAQKIENMTALIERGEHDARAGRADPAFIRYNSYVYGFTKTSCANEDGVALSDAYRRRESFYAGAAGYNARVGAAVRSLHALDAFLTDAFVCSLSPVYAQLQEGDATFSLLGTATQAMYLHEIAARAKKQRAPEKSVAQEILFRAARDDKDLSFYVLPSVKRKGAQRLWAAGSAAAVAALAVIAAFSMPALGWLYALLALPIFAFVVHFVMQRAGKRFSKRRYLPSYAPETLSAKKHATVLFFPCYAADTDDINALFEQLQTVAAANAEPIFSYAVLLDYPKSGNIAAENDAALNEAVRAAYEKLGDLRDRVCVLVRARARIRGEESWQGYEKKRGAVLDFNRYVLTGEGDFMLTLGARPAAKYAVTLDADTVLCDAVSLVCAKAHPYCADTAVLSLTCKARVRRSPFSKLYGGETGPGRYREQAFNLFNDLFGIGNFTGKGIYDIALFNKRLEGLFPDNRILSHDYAEGAAAGCLDSSVCAAEDVPQTFAESFTRDLRWLRGDWQLLPYVLPRVTNKAGERVASPLPVAARWSILSNLVLSLVPVAQMLVLLLSLFTGVPAAVWVLAALPMLLRAVCALGSLPYCARQTLYEWLRCLIDLALLPTVAAYKVCAVAVTLYRLCVGKKLLEWRVFAHAQGKVSLLPNAVAAIVFTASAAVFGLSPFYYGVSALFLAGIAAAWLLSLSAAPAAAPSDALLARLTDAAKHTFAYFAAQEEKFLLPCDCYQEDNRMGWCARTSPTNIGMALVAYAAAFELGLIDKARLLAFAERIVSAVERCEKWHGHLYNWYDCHTLAVLPARFVSTVDSGNFLASLSLLTTYTDGTLRDRMEALIAAADFRPLLDNKRKLLYIGYDDEQKTTTPNHYDLLGSESALTYLLACGYGKIPKEAFYRLDRHGVRAGRAITVYSWTGGMFEYLMARLFTAPPSDTLYAQAMRGAVRAHMRYARREKSEVWGVSECRYAAFDDAGGNLYRAFGVPDIAHSQVPEKPPFAPYAAFLALPYCGEKSFIRTLNAYAERGAAGAFGYCESYRDGVAVRSYMTHHQGMTIAACANAVKNDALPARLLSLPQWRAAQLLCGESMLTRAKRKKSFKTSGEPQPLADEGVYIGKCARLSAVATQEEVYLQYGGQRLLQNLHVSVTDGKHAELLRGAFTARDGAVWQGRDKNAMWTCEMHVLPAPLGATVTVSYRNVSGGKRRMRFAVWGDPVLSRIEDYESHPAYARLFIQTKQDEQQRSIAARRKGDSLALLLTVPEQSGVRYIGDKCALTGRGRPTDARQSGNPVLSAVWQAELGAGEEVSYTCVFAVAENTEQAEYAVRLAAADCVARYKGAALSLSRAVSSYARKTAGQLARGEWGACMHGNVPPDKQTVAIEITERTLCALSRTLSDLRLLYAAGFRFHTVLFCRKYKGEYPTLFFDAEHAVERSGIRGDAESCRICVLQCSAEQYAALKKHAPLPIEQSRVKVAGGKLVPYVADKEKPKQTTYTAARREKDEATLCALLPPIKKALGYGGFAADGAYVLPRTDTPAPWCNIMGNGEVGTVVSESGGGFTFGENARQYKFTEWSNDPVGDAVSELLAIVSDTESRSVTARPLSKGVYGTVHALGHTDFYSVYRGVQAHCKVFIARQQSRKIYELTVRNGNAAAVEFTAVCAVKAVLGDFRRNTAASLRAENVQNGVRIVSAASGCEAHLCCDGLALPVGADIADGEVRLYRELSRCRHFWGVAAPVRLAAGESVTLRFSLSAAAVEDFADIEEQATQAALFYKRLPRITFDGEYGYLTEWLPYQVYNSRFAARTGFYQVSGAYGFRDQLQDALALLYCDPALTRSHILECARHQFKEGDVQHWWHPPAVGVRTHVCDDRLWLVYTACAYAAHTGDTAVFDESVPFLRDVPIAPQDASVYTAAEYSVEHASLREHCLRAIAVSCDFGAHGLVRMRGGDWNDAMDKVGAAGVGESVWCTMFLYKAIDMFLPYVKDVETCARLRERAKDLYAAVCAAFGDGRFYRAYTDDGRILGAPQADACRIDLLTQSWSVLAGIGNAEQKTAALDSAFELLCDGEHKIIKLFDPPFSSPDGVGYIGNYPQGVRENGGQYTQAAVWYVYALFCAGQTERACKLLRWLSPAHRTRTEQEAIAYSVEPYVSAADVYAGDLAGKGGWTWYTGSASWLYQCLIEQYAGISVRGDVLRFTPHLPADTKELNVRVRFEGDIIRIKIVNGSGRGEWRVRIGEVVYNTSALKLTKGLVGKEIAVVRLPH